MLIIAPQSFTVEYPHIVREVVTDAVVRPAFDPNTPQHTWPAMTKVSAIWDTGATNTVVIPSFTNNVT